MNTQVDVAKLISNRGVAASEAQTRVSCVCVARSGLCYKILTGLRLRGVSCRRICMRISGVVHSNDVSYGSVCARLRRWMTSEPNETEGFCWRGAGAGAGWSANGRSGRRITLRRRYDWQSAPRDYSRGRLLSPTLPSFLSRRYYSYNFRVRFAKMLLSAWF